MSVTNHKHYVNIDDAESVDKALSNIAAAATAPGEATAAFVGQAILRELREMNATLLEIKRRVG